MEVLRPWTDISGKIFNEVSRRNGHECVKTCDIQRDRSMKTTSKIARDLEPSHRSNETSIAVETQTILKGRS